MEKVEYIVKEPIYENIQTGTKDVVKTKFIASDGKEFPSEQNCKAYEHSLGLEIIEKSALSKVVDRRGQTEYSVWLLFNSYEDFTEYFNYRHPSYYRNVRTVENVKFIYGDIEFPQWIRETRYYDEDEPTDDYNFETYDSVMKRYEEIKKLLGK